VEYVERIGRGRASHVLASSFLEIISTFANDLEMGKYVDTADGLTRSHG